MQLNYPTGSSRLAYCAAVVISGLYVIGGAIAPSSHGSYSCLEADKNATSSMRRATSNPQYKFRINSDIDSLAGVAGRASPRVS